MSCIPDSLEEAQALFKPLTDKWSGVIIIANEEFNNELMIEDTHLPHFKYYLKTFDFFGNSTIESIIQYIDERIESDRRCNNYVFSSIDSELGF